MQRFSLRSAVGLSAGSFVLSLATLVPHAAATDLFSITAVGNGVNTVTASDSNVIDLSESAIETFGDFASLNGQDVVATLTYAGVPNTARYTINAAGTNATLEFPITGFSRNFTGSNADDIADQIEDFIQDDGADVYAQVLEQINQQSVVAVLDGNPFATTSLLARHTFDLYGVGTPGPAWANPTRIYYRQATPTDDGYVSTSPIQNDPGYADPGYVEDGPVGWYAINPRFSFIEAGPFDGFSGGVDLAGGFYFNETFGVAAGVTLQFVDYEDTEVFHSSGHIAVPINLIPRSPIHDVSWQITPFFTSGIGGSLDAAAGGAFLGGGVSSNVRLNLGDAASVTLGGQIVHFDGQDLYYDDYEFETDLTQTLVSAGALLTLFLDGAGGNTYLVAGANYFTFLDDAAVDEWISPEVGLGFRFNEGFRMQGSYRPIFGSGDYEAHTGQVNLVFSF
jgi:hypothetical protein